jgi:hypothetical protein
MPGRGGEALRSGITRVRVKKEDISVLLESTRMNLDGSRPAANFHAELLPHGHLNLEYSHRIDILVESSCFLFGPQCVEHIVPLRRQF